MTGLPDEPRGGTPHDDAAAYALDALEPAERAVFEEHLATCARCQDEVAGFAETAATLVLADAVPPPPTALRASVLAGIRDVEQLPPVRSEEPAGEVPEARPDGRSGPRRAADPSLSPTGAATDPVVDELALRRASRRARVLSVLVAAVTVVALALGFTVWGLVRQQPPPSAGPAPSATLAGVDPALLAAPDVRVYRTTVNGASASFVVSKRQNRAVFVSADLPAAPAGDVYHLWTLNGSAVRPDATFTASGQTAQPLTGPIDASTNLAINVERAGTAPQAPTPPVLAVVNL